MKNEFFLLLAFLIPFNQGYECAECKLGCCDQWRTCASASAECFYYIGNTTSEPTAQQQCLVSSDCYTGCCIEGACKEDRLCNSAPLSISGSLECSDCALSCCDKYYKCPVKSTECVYYSGTISQTPPADPGAYVCVDSDCSIGCCYNGACATSSDQCALSVPVVFYSGLLAVMILAFCLIALVVSFRNDNKKKNDQLNLKREFLIKKGIIRRIESMKDISDRNSSQIEMLSTYSETLSGFSD